MHTFPNFLERAQMMSPAACCLQFSLVFAKQVKLGVGVQRFDDLLVNGKGSSSGELSHVVAQLEVDEGRHEVHVSNGFRYFHFVATLESGVRRLVSTRALE